MDRKLSTYCMKPDVEALSTQLRFELLVEITFNFLNWLYPAVLYSEHSEPHHEKTGFLHLRKQGRRSAVQSLHS